MDAQGSSVIVYLFLGLLALSAALIVWMLVTLVRSEVDDERRKLIVGKASTWTLIATVGGQIIWSARWSRRPAMSPAPPLSS